MCHTLGIHLETISIIMLCLEGCSVTLWQVGVVWLIVWSIPIYRCKWGVQLLINDIWNVIQIIKRIVAAGFVHNLLADVLATARAGPQKQAQTRAHADLCRPCEDDRGTLFATSANCSHRCAFKRAVRSCSSVGGCVWSIADCCGNQFWIVQLPVGKQHNIS